MTSAFIVENIFDVPGIGRFYVAATVARDYPLILGLTALLATIVVLTTCSPTSPRRCSTGARASS